jgi:D-alanine-D-alanine ligase
MKAWPGPPPERTCPVTNASERKLRVVVLMGGQSPEHDISLATGRQVAGTLDRSRYEAKAAVIRRDGLWVVPPGYGGDLPAATAPPEEPAGDERAAPEEESFPLAEALARLREERPDAVFLALHGPFGEDGTVQGLLEIAGIPYTGSGVLGSALAMDKEASRWVLERHGIPVPRTARFTVREWREGPALVSERVRYSLPAPPWFVKPADQGSSVGIRMVAGPAEVTCSVLDTPGGGEPMALPPTQIIPREDLFFDFHAKYTPGATEEVTPPRLHKDTIRKIQRAALQVHRLLALRGMSRTDMIVRDAVPIVLEVNTIPGMTRTSLLPQQAEAAGLSFPEALDRIVRVALEARTQYRTP